MACRSIGQESLNIAAASRSSSLDELSGLITWTRIAPLLEPLYLSSKGEPAWPPLAMFKALLLAVWYDLSDVKLAEALDGRASFRRFCGFSSTEATPERTAFVRLRRVLIAHGLDWTLVAAPHRGGHDAGRTTLGPNRIAKMRAAVSAVGKYVARINPARRPALRGRH